MVKDATQIITFCVSNCLLFEDKYDFVKNKAYF